MYKLLLLDTETTGLAAVDQPIELAMCLYEVQGNGQSVRQIDSYVGKRCPTVPINPRAQKVHGISIADLVGLDFNFDKINNLVESADFIVAHNARFDHRMLKGLIPNISNKQWRCTVDQWPWPVSVGKSLAKAANICNVRNQNAHAALSDVQTLADCLFLPSANGEFVCNLIKAKDFSVKSDNSLVNKNLDQVITAEAQSSCSTLLNIIGAVIADQNLHDTEIKFIAKWLEKFPIAANHWPGNIIIEQVQQILRDGVITEEERISLSFTLSEILNGNLKKAAQVLKSSHLDLDSIDKIEFEESIFLLTGDFLLGTKEECASEIERRGGSVANSMTKKVNFVVLGSLGSEQWKHGNFGTKVAKALEYKSAGLEVRIISEEVFVKYL
jgi:DNA polymerase III epsilon subunit-like protein